MPLILQCVALHIGTGKGLPGGWGEGAVKDEVECTRKTEIRKGAKRKKKKRTEEKEYWGWPSLVNKWMKLNKQERQNIPNNQKLRRMPCTGSGWSMLSYVLINIIPGLSVITPRRKSKRALIFSHNSSYFFRALRLLMRAAWALLVYVWPKLPALVYDILPSTTAVFSYATGSRKLSVNEQFFFVFFLLFFLLVLKQ